MKYTIENIYKKCWWMSTDLSQCSFDQHWYEFALLLIIAENTTPKNNLTFDDLNGSLSDSSGN